MTTREQVWKITTPSAAKTGKVQEGSHPSSTAEEGSAHQAVGDRAEVDGASSGVVPQPEPRSTDEASANGESGVRHKDGPEDTREQSAEGGEQAQAPKGSEEPAPPDSVNRCLAPIIWTGLIYSKQ